jgi:bifunctional UDP-N-acetylglucosamine pyrophosphorylase/glucosamine-1-phosphate N-acetyltransferase
MNQLSVLILAAGKGVRMKSAKPKVLHTVGGRPMVDVVFDIVSALKPTRAAVIVGHQAAEVRAHVSQRHPNAVFFMQPVLDGSGGAVRRAVNWLKKQPGNVLITCGDMPLQQVESLRALVREHNKSKNWGTVLTAKVERPFGYGRIVRRRDDTVERIVEELDANPREKAISEINTGTYCFNARALARVLPRLKNSNAKREYYLTDVLELLQKDGGRVGAVVCLDSNEALGVNRRRDLALAEAALRVRKLNELMDAGVTIMDPASTYIGMDVRIQPDTVVWPQTYIFGNSRIGSGCAIGPWAHIVDSSIENDVILQSSFVEGARIRRGARVGPYSRVRTGSDIGENAHLGNFSETKKTVLGAGSKANHLSYLGDAKIGKNVNIGAGTITCNYDGIRKSPTFIEDNAFIGSNSNLIAPVRIGAHSVVGAGSSITRNVPAWSLAVERAQTVTRKDWARKKYGKQVKAKK